MKAFAYVNPANEREAVAALKVDGIAVPIGGETISLSVVGRSEKFTQDRVAGTVRQLRRAAVVLARELRA